VAAFQVVVGHAVDFMGVELPVGLEQIYVLIRWFPGVPVFFGISGYLLARSLTRNPDLRNYARNRALRIFPGLWGCIIGTLVLLAAAGLLFELSTGRLMAFIVAQLSIGQFWAPFPISEYGLGSPDTPNPALWTIRVEIGFYLALPFLLLGGRRLLGAARRLDAGLVVVAAISFFLYSLWGDPTVDDSAYPIIGRLVVNSFAPFIWLFIAGVLLYRHEETVRRYLSGRVALWLAVFLVVRGGVWLAFEAGQGAEADVPLAVIGLANLVLLAPAFALAFSASSLVRRLHPANDISYGVYVWHLVILNALVHWDVATGWLGAVLVTIGAGVAGQISWRLIERPALSRKKASSMAEPVATGTIPTNPAPGGTLGTNPS
jgi:peptidoglycan/LPS O-acetylase OafA/YrhL